MLTGLYINQRDFEEVGVLHKAAENDGAQLAEYLIDKGALINAKDKYGATPCHVAAFHGHRKFIKCLHKKGAKLDEQTNHGATLLHMACKKDRSKVVKCLLGVEPPLDVNAKDRNLETPLHIACFEGAKGCVKLLLTKV
jgi:ankyrin repeat protein